jgi:hypothetical protein
MITIKEDTVTTHRGNGISTYLNAVYRGREAMEDHPGFFDSDEHMDRLDAITDILKSFFGRNPDYFQPRGLGGRKPFESVKMADVGRFLNKKSKEEKSQYLYEPLLALGNIKVKSTNGHLLVSVY